ncbi:MAG: peptidoglycan DD-metalloendopeptidase family protein [Candidatus Limnocylindrales bacterium]
MRSVASRFAVSTRTRSLLLLAGWTEPNSSPARLVAADAAIADISIAVAEPAIVFEAIDGVPRRGILTTPMRRRAMTVAVVAGVLVLSPTSSGSPSGRSVLAADPRTASTAASTAVAVTEATATTDFQQRRLDRQGSAHLTAARSVWGMSGRADAAVATVPSPARLVVAGDPAFDARGTLRKPLNVKLVPNAQPPAVLLYHAERGDTVNSLSRKFGITQMTIWWANRLVDLSSIRTGQLLRILPVSGVQHVVRDGDTLDTIARAYDADATAIAEYNHLSSGVVLLGQRLIVPNGRGDHYRPIADVSGLTSIPRLHPGQADRAAVAGVGLAGPLATIPRAGTLGVKTTGGVAWPSDPDAAALSTEWWKAYFDLGTAVDGSSTAVDGSSTAAGELPPAVAAPDDATPHTHATHADWGADGPEAGPPQGRWLRSDDARLTITSESVLLGHGLFWPVAGTGRITQLFGGEHHGLDIAAPRGTPILAAADGMVIYVGWRDNRGAKEVWIKHGPNLFTMYLHLSDYAVKKGDFVHQGQVIAYMGATGYATGPHLHFMVSEGPIPDNYYNERDPLLYLGRPSRF